MLRYKQFSGPPGELEEAINRWLSAFEPDVPARRAPLEPPVFHRRRLWLDQLPALDAARGAEPVNGVARDGELVASLLDFH